MWVWDDEIVVIRNFALVAVHAFLLEEKHRIVVADRRF